MNIDNMNAWLVHQEPGIEGMMRHIELCGRVCYKSEGRIDEDSYKKFVGKIKALHHLSVLEHGSIYLTLREFTPEEKGLAEWFMMNKFSDVVTDSEYNHYITTNYRVVIENGLDERIKPYMLYEPTDKHIKRFTFRLYVPISVTREANRHRALSPSEKSTRYVIEKKGITYAYSDMIDKIVGREAVDKLNETAFTEKDIASIKISLDGMCYLSQLKSAENTYVRLIENGHLAQYARGVLPLETMSEVLLTGTAGAWSNFLKLRLHPSAHPDIRSVAEIISCELKRKGVLL